MNWPFLPSRYPSLLFSSSPSPHPLSKFLGKKEGTKLFSQQIWPHAYSTAIPAWILKATEVSWLSSLFQLLLSSLGTKTMLFHLLLQMSTTNNEGFLYLLMNVPFFRAISEMHSGYVLSTLTKVYSPCFVCDPKRQNIESNPLYLNWSGLSNWSMSLSTSTSSLALLGWFAHSSSYFLTTTWTVCHFGEFRSYCTSSFNYKVKYYPSNGSCGTVDNRRVAFLHLSLYLFMINLYFCIMSKLMKLKKYWILINFI